MSNHIPKKIRDVLHDDVIKWKHFPRYWSFVRGIHRSPVNSPHKGQWRGALIFSLIYVWINGWVNNREAGDLGRYRAHYDVTVMTYLRLNPYQYLFSKRGPLIREQFVLLRACKKINPNQWHLYQSRKIVFPLGKTASRIIYSNLIIVHRESTVLEKQSVYNLGLSSSIKCTALCRALYLHW